MPLQNRVTPEGMIIAVDARGTMMGNRGGRLHDAQRRLGARRWMSRQWICCRLEFNDRKRAVMGQNSYTELFFLDEATAMAAGHRPCFECRRQDFLWFATLWARTRDLNGRGTAGEIDQILHAERVDGMGSKPTYQAPAASLPSGTFVRLDGAPHLVLAGWLLAWSPGGYTASVPRPDNRNLDVLTPRSIVAVLSAGYSPMLHATANIAG